MSIWDDMMAAGATANAGGGGAADPFAAIRQLKFANNPYMSDTGLVGRDPEKVDRWDLAGETGWDDLKAAGFQSKYNEITELEPGRFIVKMQQPGKHKYDTMSVMYEVNPETGMAEMKGQVPTRETSSRDSWQDFAEKAAILTGAVVGGGYALQSAVGAAGAAGGAGGAGGYVSPELVGGSFGPGSAQLGTAEFMAGSAYTSPELVGGSFGEGSAQLSPWELPMDNPAWAPNPADYSPVTQSPMPYEQTVEIPGQRLPTETNFGNPEIDNLIPQVDANGNPLGQTIPQADYSNEGRNYPTPESTQGPGGSPVNSSPPIPSTPGTPGTSGTTPGSTPGVPGTTPSGAPFNWGQLMSGIMTGLSGLYGMSLADDMREASDPFAKYRGYYGDRLMELEKNPSLITQRPGWKAGVEAIDRGAASQGYIGSGNAMAALSRYGGNFYNDETKRLATLAGAGQTPGAGLAGAANLSGSGLEGIAGGIGQLIELLGGKP